MHNKGKWCKRSWLFSSLRNPMARELHKHVKHRPLKKDPCIITVCLICCCFVGLNGLGIGSLCFSAFHVALALENLGTILSGYYSCFLCERSSRCWRWELVAPCCKMDCLVFLLTFEVRWKLKEGLSQYRAFDIGGWVIPTWKTSISASWELGHSCRKQTAPFIYCSKCVFWQVVAPVHPTSDRNSTKPSFQRGSIMAHMTLVSNFQQFLIFKDHQQTKTKMSSPSQSQMGQIKWLLPCARNPVVSSSLKLEFMLKLIDRPIERTQAETKLVLLSKNRRRQISMI